LVSWYY